MAGGGLMTFVGLAYLVLEDFILSDVSSSKTKLKRLHTSRTLLGIQVNNPAFQRESGSLHSNTGWTHHSRNACYTLQRNFTAGQTWPSQGESDRGLVCSR